MIMIITVFLIINPWYTGAFLRQLSSLHFAGGNSFPEQNDALGVWVIFSLLGGDFNNLGKSFAWV